VRDGHDGTWVAHPGLVPVAKEIFDAEMKGPNQIDRKREDVNVGERDLLEPPQGTRTVSGLRHNIKVGVQYLEAWLRGSGAVPIFNLMEDAATAEISRAQVWQWIRHPRGTLDDGRKVTKELFRTVLDEELGKIESSVGAERFARSKYAAARKLFDSITTDDKFVDFLTLAGYDKFD
jgi:malate synthase